MQVLEWTDTEKRLSTDHESQSHFQISKKKLDEWEPVKSGFRSKGKLMTVEGTSTRHRWGFFTGEPPTLWGPGTGDLKGKSEEP